MKKRLFLRRALDKRGAVAVITAVSLVFILIAAAFVIDFGLAYLRTAHMQNAADSASLAAASLLPVACGDSSGIYDVEQKALDYLTKNDIDIDADTINVTLNLGASNMYTSVTVEILKESKLYIAPVIGVDELDVSRLATAQVSPTVNVRRVVPLSITEEYLDYAKSTGGLEHLELKLGASDEDVLMGAFGALDLDGGVGGGASVYEAWLKYGFEGSLSVGQVIPIEPGNMSNPTMNGIEYRLDLCTHFPSDGGCTTEHFVETCPRVVIVPVIMYNGPHDVTIKGFAAFLVEGCAGQGHNSIVTGTFVRDIVVNGQGDIDDSLGGPNDFGIYSITLIE